MRILVATGLYPPEIGGPATHAKQLEEYLPSQGIEVVVVPFANVRHLPKIVRHLAYLGTLLRQGRRAVRIYALDPVSVGLPALLASRLLGVPFILRVPGDYAWEQATGRYGYDGTLDAFQEEWRTARWLVRLLRRTETFVARRAACVVVPSEYLARVVSGWGVLPERIEVVHSTFIPPRVGVSSEEVRARHGVTGPLIVSAGRLVPWKGFRALMAALVDAGEGVPDSVKEADEPTLLIVGDGPERLVLEEYQRERGLKNVRLLSTLPHDALMELISAADLFVLNTSYEGLSHLLLEAMALGTPVLTTTAGGNTELIRDGENGRLVPVGDTEALAVALRELLHDEVLRARLAHGGEETAGRFASTEPLAQIATLLEKDVRV